MSEHDETVYRTSPGRAAKLMTILVGLVVVGGVIYFSLGDYWISELSPAGMAFAGITDEPAAPAVAQTGADIPITLDFIESKDFRTLAFNALPGELGNNPTINAKVGDRIIFNILNAGKSFHSFGVTLNEEGFGGILSGTDVAAAKQSVKAWRRWNF